MGLQVPRFTAGTPLDLNLWVWLTFGKNYDIGASRRYDTVALADFTSPTKIVRGSISEVFTFYESQKFAGFHKVNKPICELH